MCTEKGYAVSVAARNNNIAPYRGAYIISYLRCWSSDKTLRTHNAHSAIGADDGTG